MEKRYYIRQFSDGRYRVCMDYPAYEGEGGGWGRKEYAEYWCSVYNKEIDATKQELFYI